MARLGLSTARACAGRSCGKALLGRTALAVCMALPLMAAAPAIAAPPGLQAAPDQDAATWLRRMGEAGQRVSFEGVITLSSGPRATSARIAHYSDGRNVVERIEALDGPPRVVFRHNEQVKTVWPERHHAVTGTQDSLASLAGALRAADASLLRHYEATVLGSDRVAGRRARVLLLRPRDDWRLGHRFWADEATGLLLRAEVLAADGRVLEWSALSSVDIGVPPQPQRVLDDMRRDAGLAVRQVRSARVDPGRLGWSVGPLPPGFRLVGAVNRPRAADVAETPPPRGPDAAADMLQLVFSDGLTHVSVFIEPFDAARHRREGQGTAGATHTLVRRAGSWWLTAVGDVPSATLQGLTGALRREAP